MQEREANAESLATNLQT